MRRRGALLITLLCVLAARVVRAEEPASFAIATARATLEVDGRSVAALPPGTRVGPPGTLEWTPDRNRLRARDTATGKDAWVAVLPVGRRWFGLASDAKTAYGLLQQADVWELTLPPTGRTTVDWVADGEDRVRRLSLANGTWLPAWSVEGRVRVVVPMGDDVVVVSDPELGRVVFTCFAATADAPRWTRSIRSPLPPGTGPEYLGSLPSGDRPWWGTPEPVAAADDVVVTCAGAAQEIVALDRVDGSIRWQLDRLWELDVFQRSEKLPDPCFARPTTDASRADLARRCRIVAGPIVLGEGEGQRVFFGVTRDRVEGTEVEVAESVTYEVRGASVVSIAQLPRPLVRTGAAAVGGGVLWPCRDGALAFQRPSTDSLDLGGWLAWYRDPGPAPARDVWLRTGRGSPCLVADGVAAWSVSDGPYVRSATERAFRVPLRRLDLATGAVRDVVLVVPFSGDVPAPEPTRFRETGGRGETRIEVYEPFTLEVLALKLDGDRLVVDLAATNGGGRIVFPTESLK